MIMIIEMKHSMMRIKKQQQLMAASEAIVDHRSQLSEDLFALLMKGSSNDIKIILDDGEIYANKDILAIRSDYFSTMFSNTAFVEGKSGEVTVKNCTKEVMMAMLRYIFTGTLNLQIYRCCSLLEMMNLSRSMLLKNDMLFQSIESYVKRKLPKQSFCDVKNILWAYILIDVHKLDNLRGTIINEVYHEVQNYNSYYNEAEIKIFQNFTFSMIKDLLLFDSKHVKEKQPTIKDKFDLFLDWYKENKENCSEENKKIILDSFNLDDFSGEELLTVVRKSGLFPEEDVINKVLEKLRKYEAAK